MQPSTVVIITSMATLAEVAPGMPDWLAPAIGQFGMGGILAWMLWQQKEERAAERERQRLEREAMSEERLAMITAINEQRHSIDRQTHAMTILSVRIGSISPNAALADKEKAILRDLGSDSG